MVKKIVNSKIFKVLSFLIRSFIWLVASLVVVLIVTQRIFNNEFALGNYRIFTIVSGSMLPEYQLFDVILVGSEDYDKIKVGDDLVYLGKVDDYAGKIITHRVINISSEDGKYMFTTKGVNNPLEDPVVEESQVYGIVRHKTVVLSFLSKIINNSYGFYFLVFVPITLLIFLELMDHFNEKEEELENESKE